MAKEVYDPPLPWTGEIAAPLVLFRGKVRPEWIDSFEHVNIAHYLTICDHANWAFWNWINHPEGTMEARAGHEYVIVENHVHYIDELALGQPFAAAYEDRPGERSWSLRSRGDTSVDVAKIAELFGGGGHHHASGFSTSLAGHEWTLEADHTG